ncbi:MAG: HlyD family efflux transporter periplasmic adaptor subunit [Candidatus Eisenbacteria bacterium]
MNRLLVRLGLLLVAACGLLAGCGKPDGGSEAPADPVVAVRAAAVSEHTFRDGFEAPGRWKSAVELALRAPAAGFIEVLRPRPGDRVRVGEVVGSVLTRESRAALEGAQLLLREATTEGARAEGQRALALARRELVHVPLVAREAGVVLRRSAEPGMQIDDGAEILALVPASGLVFEAHVPPAWAARVRPGQAGEILVAPAAPRLATVRSILPQADPNDQSTLVWLVPVTGGSDPTLERFGSARIETGAPHTSPAVPEGALIQDDLTGEPRVALIDSSGRAAWTVLTVGIAQDGWREVLSPRLRAGTRVVIEGQHGLADRARVEVAR